MAYPIVPAAYGLKPVSLAGGRVFSGSTRLIPIASNYGYNMFDGDVVTASGGSLVVTTLGAASSPVAGTIGVFVGAQYVNSMSQTVRAQFYAANTITNTLYGPNSLQGYVVDDPYTVFQAAVLTQGTSSVSNTPGATIGYVNPSFIGSNMYLVTNGSNGGSASGNTTTGDSAMGLTGGVVTSGTQGNTRVTSTAPFRVVNVVPDTAVTVTATSGTATSSSATLTMTAANTAISPGMQLIIPGVTGALASNFLTVTNVSTTTLTLSATVSVPAGTALSFVGYPEVQVQWNFGYHGYLNATAA
jgi:hypothetical protein